MLISAFVLRFKVNYLAKYAATSSFLCDLQQPLQRSIFSGLKLVQKPLYLVGTVLKMNANYTPTDTPKKLYSNSMIQNEDLTSLTVQPFLSN